MKFPVIAEETRISRLTAPTGRVRMVLDTDTYNEIDDQFAVVYSLLSPEKIDVEAIYAAPFHNDRSSGPRDGMEKSYDEILRLLQRLDRPHAGFVLKGSTAWLTDGDTAQESAAARDLVRRAMDPARREPLYVVAIGAVTNVASAILMEPRIIERIVVVWLGGNARHWPDTWEFNLQQDPAASRILFDSGVPLVQMPCFGVTSHLTTTVMELEHHIGGSGEIGAFLTQRVREYHKDHFAWAKEIWDIVTIGWLINADWVPSTLVHSPVLTSQMTWSVDERRHFIRCAYMVWRNGILRDMFTKIQQFAQKK